MKVYIRDALYMPVCDATWRRNYCSSVWRINAFFSAISHVANWTYHSLTSCY